jgi:chromosome segregation ATPase
LEASVPKVVLKDSAAHPKAYALETHQETVAAAQRLLGDLKRAVWAYLFQVDIEKVSVDVSFGGSVDSVSGLHGLDWKTERVNEEVTRAYSVYHTQVPGYNKALWVEKEALLVANRELRENIQHLEGQLKLSEGWRKAYKADNKVLTDQREQARGENKLLQGEVAELRRQLEFRDIWGASLQKVKEKLQAEVANLKGKAQDDADLFEDQLGQKDLEIQDLKKSLVTARSSADYYANEYCKLFDKTRKG